MHALLLRSSAAALLLLASHAVAAPSGVVLYQGRDYAVCWAITAALGRLQPPIRPTDWVTRLPPIRGMTQPAWRRGADAAVIPSDVLPHPGLIYGPAEEATIPGVVIETPPAMGTNTFVKIDFHLIRRAMRDDGTGRNPEVEERRGQMLGWSFEAVDLTLFPGVTHARIGFHLIPYAMVLSGGQPWFGKVPGALGTLDAVPALAPSPPDHAGLLIRQRCLIGSAE